MKKTVYPPYLRQGYRYHTEWPVNVTGADTVKNLVNYLLQLVLEVPCGHFSPSKSFYYAPSEDDNVTQHAIVVDAYPATIADLFPIISPDVLLVRIKPGNGSRVLVRVDTNWPDVFETAPQAILAGLQKLFDVESDQRNSNDQEHNEKDPSQPKKQKGRYRLTKEEIRKRRAVVRAAEKLRKESDRTWLSIADELDISERTLRDWRHNPQINK